MADKYSGRTDVYQIVVLTLILASLLVIVWMFLTVRNTQTSIEKKLDLPAPQQEQRPEPNKYGFTVPPPPRLF